MNTIKVKKYLDILEERTATAVAITPGMLLELTSAGTVQAHSAAGGNVLPMVALEDELQGNDIDDNYAVSAQIQIWIPMRGAEFYGILLAGEDVSVGDFLESDGTGKLKKYVADSADSDDEFVSYPNQIVGIAMEASDTSLDVNLIVKLM